MPRKKLTKKEIRNLKRKRIPKSKKFNRKIESFLKKNYPF